MDRLQTIYQLRENQVSNLRLTAGVSGVLQEVPLEEGVMAWPPDGKSPPKARSGNGGALA